MSSLSSTSPPGSLVGWCLWCPVDSDNVIQHKVVVRGLPKCWNPSNSIIVPDFDLQAQTKLPRMQSTRYEHYTMNNLVYNCKQCFKMLVQHTIPVSTIYFTPGIVREVSATLVATTHSLTPSGGGTNTCMIDHSLHVQRSSNSSNATIRYIACHLYYRLEINKVCQLLLASYSTWL